MESFNFIAPARVKFLLIPVDGISLQDFHRYAEIIKSVTDIRLLDISPIPKCRHFNPQEFPQGRIFLSPTDEASNDTTFLDDFEPFRKTFVVIGVGVSLVSTPNLIQTLDALKKSYPSAISHNIIYNESLAGEGNQNEIFHISREAGKISTSIETVLCGVTRNFLITLDEYASSYESITLRSPISLTDSSVLARTINLAQKRLSSGLSFKTLFSNGQAASPTIKDLKLKSLQRQAGRQAKIMGNFFLLAGRAQDALQYFTDAAINAKKTDDYIWLASALEGVSVSATILSFLGLSHQIQNPMFASVLQINKSKGISLMKGVSKASVDEISSRQSILAATPRNSMSSSLSLGTHQPSPHIDVSQVQIIELLFLITLRCSYFYKLSTSEVEDCVPDIVYVDSLLRNAKLMVTIYLSKTSDSSTIIKNLIDSCLVINEKGGADIQLLQNKIVCEIDQIFALQLSKLNICKQCQIYCALASIYEDLGLQRKRGLVLRLLLTVLLQEISDMELKSVFNHSGSKMSIRSIIDSLLKIYHISEKSEKFDSPVAKQQSNWVALQLLLIKVCLRIAEAFHDNEYLIHLCATTLSRFTHCLPVEDQIKLRDKLLSLSLLAETRPNDLQAPHPDPFIIRDAKFIVLPRATTLISLRANDSASSSKFEVETNDVFFDPFNNPNKKANMDRVICQNEVHHLKVVLQNPFRFSLGIRLILASAEDGFSLETITSVLKVVSISQFGQPQNNSTNTWKNSVRPKMLFNDQIPSSLDINVSIPPNSAVELIIGFRALEAGPFHIQGFNIDFEDFKSQFFRIVDQELYSVHYKLTYDRVSKLKEPGKKLKNQFENLLITNVENRATYKVVSLTAIPSQPTLSIVKTSKLSDWEMLLEGEIKSSSVKLKNCSKYEVDYLTISPWDSTIESINSRLHFSSSQNNLNAAEVYELEWLLLERKGLIVTNKSEIASTHKVIPPGGEVNIDYNIAGKRGMVELKLILEYGKKLLQVKESNFLKKLIVSCNISVHRSLEIVSSDIIPLLPSTWAVFSESNDQFIGELAQESWTDLLDFIARIKRSATGNLSDHCLLILEIKNFWKDLLVASVTSTIDNTTFEVKQKILPNKSAKFFIPIKRIGESNIDLTKNIPPLRNKQFLKNSRTNKEEEFWLRRSFWVREELLKCLLGKWVTIENSAHRRGEIDLRKIRLSTSMTESLICNDLQINLEVLTEEEPETKLNTQGNKLFLRRETFYTLRTKIVNHSKRPSPGILRHIPIPSNASNRHDLSIDLKILFNGALQIHIGTDDIGAESIHERDIGFMILEKGQYEWGCMYDTSGNQGKRIIGREPIYIIAS